MNDLTIVYLTTNRVPEEWQKYQISTLPKYPIVSVSCKPMDLGTNIIQDREPSKPNIFYQLMRGLKLVKTKYFAVVEDDTLYPPEHFEFRPKNDEFAYNSHRWSLYTWNPVYSLKNWIRTGAVLIAPTKLALEVLEERFSKYPMDSEMPQGMCGELGVYEKEMGLTPRKVIDFKTENAVVQLDHDFFTIESEKTRSKETVERRHRKQLGIIKATSIPYWGDAISLVDRFI